MSRAFFVVRFLASSRLSRSLSHLALLSLPSRVLFQSRVLVTPSPLPLAYKAPKKIRGKQTKNPLRTVRTLKKGASSSSGSGGVTSTGTEEAPPGALATTTVLPLSAGLDSSQ